MAEENKVKEGTLRVWWIRNSPNKGVHYYVTSPEIGYALLQGLAFSDLENNDVGANAGGMEVFEDGEWLEWECEDGENVDDVFKFQSMVIPVETE